MRSKWSPFRLSPRWQWVKWPALGFGGGGTAVGVWLAEEPLLAAGEVCLPLAVLPGLYGIVYGFYHHVFRSHLPRQSGARHDPSHRRVGVSWRSQG